MDAGGFAAVDEGLLAGEGHQAFGQGEHLQDGGIAVILHGERAGPLDVAEDVDLADFGDADLLAAGEGEVEGGVGIVDEAADVDAAGELTGVPSGPGWERLTRISRPASSRRPWARAMASRRVVGPSAWKTRGILTAPATLMGRLWYSAMVTVTKGSTRICSSRRAVAMAVSRSDGIGVLGFDALLEHGEAEEAIGADADGTAEFRGVVDGDGDQVIRADGLGGEIGADFGHGERAARVGVGRLRRDADCKE